MRNFALLTVACMVMAASAMAQTAAPGTETVTIPLEKYPSGLDREQTVLSGVCNGVPDQIHVRYAGDGPDLKVAVTVSIGETHTHYDQVEQFVHDLFAAKNGFQYRLACFKETPKADLILSAFGVSPAGADSPRPAEARVDFGEGGKLLHYTGITAEHGYQDVQRYMR